MALFNKKTEKNKRTINRAGGEAFVQSPKMQLVSLLLTSFAQDQYYRSAEQTFEDLNQLLVKVNPYFAAKAAIFARKEFGMRSISHVLAGELAAYASGTTWAKDFYRKVIKRPDDMLEIISYFKAKGGNGLPNAMKKGFAKAFDQFDSYQLAKYRGEKKATKLVDLVNLVHPIPTELNEQALKHLIKGKLKATQTWEARLTEAGQAAENDVQKAKMKAKVWNDLIRENKLGYFALLRNLRNISAQSPKVLALACKQLIDPKRIKNSLVMPFRLITAYKQFTGNSPANRKIREALEKAINIACNNVPDLENTLVVIDNSGSMACKAAGSKHMKCNELGAAFGIILAKRSNADIMEFGSKARYINYSLRDSVMEFSSSFEDKNRVGHGTDFHSIFRKANRKYDRIVIFSDMQGWVGHTAPTASFEAYKTRFKVNPYLYSFDLAGYGSLQFPEDKVFQLAGFSEKVFGMMGALEQNPNELLDRIEAIEL